MTNMSIRPLWLTHFIEILLVLEFQLTKFIFSAFSYKARFRPQISSNEWFISNSRLILMTFWPSRISIQDFTTDSALFCFFCFSMDKIKASQLENWELLFPTHPPLFFLHFIGLAFFFHLLDKSLMIFPICEVLDIFGKCFSHLWGFAIFW